MKAINTHINNSDVCKNGCGALNSMTANNGKLSYIQNKNMHKQSIAENQKKAVAAGGIEAVVKAISTHIRDTDICKCGCDALETMAIGDSKLLATSKINKANR